MKKYSDLLKENQQENLDADILVIVDVQKVFGKFIPQDFEKKLNLYCKKFKEVIQIWDSNKTNKPSWKFDNQSEFIRKNYGTKFSNTLVKVTDNLDEKYPNAKEGDAFKVGDDYVVKIDNNHKWFYLNDDLQELYGELKGKKVIVTGGADSECLTDVYVSMKSFGVNVVYNHEYIYSAQTSNKQQATIK